MATISTYPFTRHLRTGRAGQLGELIENGRIVLSGHERLNQQGALALFGSFEHQFSS